MGNAKTSRPIAIQDYETTIAILATVYRDMRHLCWVKRRAEKVQRSVRAEEGVGERQV